MKRLYSTFEVSALCGVDPTTVARWCDSGTLPCTRNKMGQRRIEDTALRSFLRKQGIKASLKSA